MDKLDVDLTKQKTSMKKFSTIIILIFVSIIQLQSIAKNNVSSIWVSIDKDVIQMLSTAAQISS